MIGVVSSPDHFKARSAIRSTWGAEAKRMNIPVKFFVGELDQQKEGYKDIAAHLTSEDDVVRVTGFTESYHNLTAKAISIFLFAKENDFSGVMKVDDDTFINVKYLQTLVGSQSKVEETFMGYLQDTAAVVKNPGSRWYTFDQYPH